MLLPNSPPDWNIYIYICHKIDPIACIPYMDPMIMSQIILYIIIYIYQLFSTVQTIPNKSPFVKNQIRWSQSFAADGLQGSPWFLAMFLCYPSLEKNTYPLGSPITMAMESRWLFRENPKVGYVFSLPGGKCHFILYYTGQTWNKLFALNIFCWPNWYYIYCWFSIVVLVCVSKLLVYMYHLNILKKGILQWWCGVCYCVCMCMIWGILVSKRSLCLFCSNISTQTTANMQAFRS